MNIVNVLLIILDSPNSNPSPWTFDLRLSTFLVFACGSRRVPRGSFSFDAAEMLKSSCMRAPVLSQSETEALEELKLTLQGFLGEELKDLILFGSKARGEAEPESDIDVAILVETLTRERKRQIFDLVAEIELKYLVVISSLVLSVEEFGHLKSREKRIALDIESEGIPL